MSTEMSHPEPGESADTLVLMPSLTARPVGGGRLLLTDKFVDGVNEYVNRWPGRVEVWIEVSQRDDGNLGLTQVHPDDVPFGLHELKLDEPSVRSAVRRARVVSASMVNKHLHLADICRQEHVPLVFIAEFSLKTRLQIDHAENANPLRRWRRQFWNRGFERRILAALPKAVGIQCNGTPTYEAYCNISKNPLLYFDSRITQDMIASEDVVTARIVRMRQGGPLRLCFSGRLIAMKGADHLPKVAAHLVDLGVDFTMDICGAGLLENSMKQEISQRNLDNHVRMMGLLDFQNELLPHIAQHVDLFVCCHPQGDPSCTYLETMACGSPIVGYDNEAFDGIVRITGLGWKTPMGNPLVLARKIAELDQQRDQLADAAMACQHFALENTFPRTMDARVDHLMQCCGLAEATTAS
jgi:colanic acid/amylovoran biosynthesis glycosyltransferase